MTSTCPQGHTSATDDFCDVCGTPIEPAAGAALEPAPTVRSEPTPAPAPVAPVAPAAGPPKTCPNCQAGNAADALFCEDCGYDFATGQLPPPPEHIDPISGRVTPSTAAAPPGLGGVAWVAEVWVDPDWFTHQQAAGSCPTSGVPTVFPLRGAVQLIGRRSRSRSIKPEIDCSGDGAISHRHAELSMTGERWSVKDLGSTNGTYVGEPGDYPDQQLPPQQRRELADDERIYLGAWTRIVVRRATDAEKDAS
jgi:FHA domain-containing protein/double zinc ribbon protein